MTTRKIPADEPRIEEVVGNGKTIYRLMKGDMLLSSETVPAKVFEDGSAKVYSVKVREPDQDVIQDRFVIQKPDRRLFSYRSNGTRYWFTSVERFGDADFIIGVGKYVILVDSDWQVFSYVMPDGTVRREFNSVTLDVDGKIIVSASIDGMPADFRTDFAKSRRSFLDSIKKGLSDFFK